MDLTLTPKEADLLNRILERALADLRLEIAHTDRKAFKSGLQVDETLLASLLDRVSVTSHCA